jgi:hypothetical protein
MCKCSPPPWSSPLPSSPAYDTESSPSPSSLAQPGAATADTNKAQATIPATSGRTVWRWNGGVNTHMHSGWEWPRWCRSTACSGAFKLPVSSSTYYLLPTTQYKYLACRVPFHRVVWFRMSLEPEVGLLVAPALTAMTAGSGDCAGPGAVGQADSIGGTAVVQCAGEKGSSLKRGLYTARRPVPV